MPVLLCAALAVVAAAAHERTIAPMPPMGWNSWDAYGLTINESDFKANAIVLATLKRLGWTYAVIDEGWYMENPLGDKLETRNYQLDAHGLLVPTAGRFPSSAHNAGFKPLAGWVHAQGLKFGLHIVRGIPKQAVRDNLPIADSAFSARDAADTLDTCPWDDGDYGVRNNAAGQAYYDSMLKLYASWGLDFLKVDCIADHPYKASEIRQIAAAIAKTGRHIVLSLSPGPTRISHAAEVGRHAQMWRISNDIWDGWSFSHEHPDDDFPNGVITAFDNLAKWAPYAKPGNWPDADMLPFGSLAPHPGWGEPRQSRLTQDEERTQFTLWSIARSPLILGGNLTKLDEFTKSLITNRAILGLDKTGHGAHPLESLPPEFKQVRVWATSQGTGETQRKILAVFNLGDTPFDLHATWVQLGFAEGRHSARSLWDDVALAGSERLGVSLPAHGSAVWQVD
ncbi:MAG TPA: glycoside hydrolase family 27 protein [Steroidobacteraceae bacterium]|nr:glycoside hydrolase family 27 protein [Steroidobacteraceae bacterium]